MTKMKAKIEDVNIRGREEKINKKGEAYCLVRFEDEGGKAYELVDKDMERAKYYTRDTEGDLIIDISQGKYTTIRIVDFKIKQG